MKTILLILFLALPVFGQQWVNTNTGQYVSALPAGAVLPGGAWMSKPDSNTLVSLGWLMVSNTIAPVAGWVTTSNAIIPYVPINGWCYLQPAASNNIQAVFNASVTNNPNWTLGFVATLKTWRSVLQSYNGVGKETNAVVNWTTASNYFATNQAFIAIPTNSFNAGWLVDGATPIQQLGFTNTASFWWWAESQNIIP